jgi:hypothetical protein
VEISKRSGKAILKKTGNSNKILKNNSAISLLAKELPLFTNRVMKFIYRNWGSNAKGNFYL